MEQALLVEEVLWQCDGRKLHMIEDFLLADGIHFHAVLFSYLPDCYLAWTDALFGIILGLQ